MKKVLTLFLSLGLLLPANAFLMQRHFVDFRVAPIIDGGTLHPGGPRTPILTPVAELDGYLLSICDHPNYVLQLIGEDETVVYKMPLPAGVNQVTLPASYTGQFELRLLWGNWYFFSIIELN